MQDKTAQTLRIGDIVKFDGNPYLLEVQNVFRLNPLEVVHGFYYGVALKAQHTNEVHTRKVSQDYIFSVCDPMDLVDKKELNYELDKYIGKYLQIEQKQAELQELRNQRFDIENRLRPLTVNLNPDEIYVYKYQGDLYQIEFNENGEINSLTKLEHLNYIHLEEV